MPDINQLFDNLHVAHLRALHAPTGGERAVQHGHVRRHRERLHVHAYPQPGSFLPC
ncbi:hypothetical protein [Blastomonas natatoria]|uniref:hypothetical protein n=1 Tax=Blastomonas natatoria TaxID=34015 RepID=UPI00142D33BD|nr:hypothetical protein [Blastomonas natatoria]